MTYEQLYDFCGSDFWDANTTWLTESPELSDCFEQTVLVWIPSVFLAIFLPLDLHISLKSHFREIPWNWKNLSKLFVNIILALVCVVEFVYSFIHLSEGAVVYYVHIYTPVIKFVTLLICIGMTLYHRKFGQMSSGLLCMFWLAVCILGIPQFRTDLNSYEHENHLPLLRITYLIYFCLCVVMSILNFFADDKPLHCAHSPQENPCPEKNSSFPSRLTYTWFDKLIILGLKRPLVHSDLWNLNESEQTSIVSEQFEYYWDKAKAKYQKKEDSTPKKVPKGKKTNKDSDESDDNEALSGPSILGPMLNSFSSTFVSGAFLKLIYDVIAFFSPLLLKLLIEFVEGKEPMWRGYLYVASFVAVGLIQSMINSQYAQRMFLVGMRIRTSIMSAVYKKSLRISTSSRKDFTVGEIVNLMAVDAQRLMDVTCQLNIIWSGPLQMFICLYLLWQILGPSVLAGLVVMTIMIPVNGFCAGKIETLQSIQMENKDSRVKIINEILSGIKVLKLYAWEKCFKKQVDKIRDEEIKQLKHILYYYTVITFLWTTTPFMVSLVTFAVFIYSDESNIFDAETAFVSLALFNILRVPFVTFPLAVLEAVQCWVSVKRINKFLNMEELDPDCVTRDEDEADPLIMEKCSFSWYKKGELILKDISLRVKRGSLVAVVGAVGSGKSSLLSAFLGEMEKISGKINMKGSLAYVPQIAWIQNNTLRDNILFGKGYRERMYKRVISACCLIPDFKMLPGKDYTEIGEKGINLSGGQKQRVSLARAVYSDADVYFLDDPLSAVDSHVGKHIFNEVIGPKGILGRKTRLFVTHGITHLPEADVIVVLKDGFISEVGTYQELLDKRGEFSNFIVTHIQDIVETDDQEELNEALGLKQTLLKSHPDFAEKLSQHLSRQTSLTSVTSDSSSIISLPGSNRISKNSKHGVLTAGDLIEDEKAEIGQVKWSIYKTYLKSIGNLFPVLACFTFVVYESFSVGGNIWLSVWTGDSEIYVNGTVNASKRDMYLGIYALLGMLQNTVTVFTDLIPTLSCWWAGVVMHNRLLDSVLRFPLSFFDTNPSGRILARFSKDVDVLDNILPRFISDSCWCFFEVIGILLVISYSSPYFMICIIPMGIMYYTIQRCYIATSRQINRLNSVSRSPIYSHFSESITGASSIRAYNVQSRFILESEDKIDLNQICVFPGLISLRWVSVRLDLVGTLIVFFAALFAVLSRDWVNPGLVGLSLAYAFQMTDMFGYSVRMYSEVEINIVAVERIVEYTEQTQEASWEVEGSQVKSDWPERGEVEFRDFKVRYREGLDCVLKGINFSTSGGEKVGVVGRTGAGKSSLTLSLFRIIEAAEGAIFIDGIDISKLGLHTLRSRLTIIPQDPVLFSGTLRLNVDPHEMYSDEKVWRSLELAHLKDFVSSQLDGLQYDVSEGGENLSVGQRQLICLARALLRKTKVLILDEATAAVDLETDDLIQKTIRSEFADCTVLTIAHRINTIMDSDRVMVLENGFIMEFDNPDNLLRNQKSIFYSLAHDAGLI